MVAKDVESDLAIMTPRRGQQLLKPLFVNHQFGANRGRAIARQVEQSVQLRPVNKSEIDSLARHFREQACQVLFLRPCGVTDGVRDFASWQESKVCRAAI